MTMKTKRKKTKWKASPQVKQDKRYRFSAVIVLDSPTNQPISVWIEEVELTTEK